MLRRVDAELRQTFANVRRDVRRQGVGLSANQVDLPYRLFVLNLKSDPAARDQELVFLNPVISQRSGNVEKEEGCLSSRRFTPP